MRTVAAGQFADLRHRLVAAFGHDVGGAEVAAQVGAVGVAAVEDDLLGAEPLGGQHRAQSDRAVADDGHRRSRPHPGGHGAVVAGAEHVGQRQQRRHQRRILRDRKLHQRALRLRNAHGFALAGVDAPGAPATTVPAGRLQALSAEVAGVVGPDERGDHQIAALEAGDLGADVLDDADELVAHPAAAVLVRHGLVRPQVAAADACAGDPHDGVGGILEDGVGHVLDAHVAGFVHHGCSHCSFRSKTDRPGQPAAITDVRSSVKSVDLRLDARSRQDPGVTAVRGTQYPQSEVGRLYRGEMGTIDLRHEVREFLSSRRARISPEQAGLPAYGGNRRVKGLRREEVALLAGVSIDYYVRMERGNLSGASESVLDSLASALQLDDAERDHLFALARESGARPRRRRKRKAAAACVPSLQQVLDAITDAPAWIRNGRHDVLAMNQLGPRAVRPGARRSAPAGQHHPLRLPRSRRPKSSSSTTTRSPATRRRCFVWKPAAILTMSELIALVGELSTRSELFRQRWASQDVRFHRSAASGYDTRWSASSTWTSRPWNCRPNRALQLNIYTAAAGTPDRRRTQTARLLGRQPGEPAVGTSDFERLTRGARPTPAK